MKKIVTILVLLFLTLGFVNLAIAKDDDNGCNGAIWTTDENGGIQDKNHYLVNERVYLNAANFDDDEECTWEIKKLPHDVISSGDINTDSDGKIDAALLYTTQPGDVGSEFQVTLECDECKKHDNYRVDEPEEVPEFSTIAAIVALVGSLGIFMIVRKRH